MRPRNAMPFLRCYDTTTTRRTLFGFRREFLMNLRTATLRKDSDPRALYLETTLTILETTLPAYSGKDLRLAGPEVLP